MFVEAEAKRMNEITQEEVQAEKGPGMSYEELQHLTASSETGKRGGKKTRT